MVNHDPEWERWRDDYRALSEPPSATELRRRVARHGRLLRFLLWSELTLVAASVVLPLWWLAIAPEPWKWPWAVVVWTLEAFAIAFAVWNRWGTWRPADHSLAAQLDLAELRCRRQVRTLRFVPIFFAVEGVACLWLIAHYKPRNMAAAAGILAAAGLGIGIWWAIFRAHTRRRLSQVAALRRDWYGDAE